MCGGKRSLITIDLEGRRFLFNIINILFNIRNWRGIENSKQAQHLKLQQLP